jgi:hypothetical protein
MKEWMSDIIVLTFFSDLFPEFSQFGLSHQLGLDKSSSFLPVAR